MKDYFITLDTGTTNTRAVLWHRDGTPVCMERCGAGVRDTAADGTNTRLMQNVRQCLECLLEKGGQTYRDVEGVFASGMLTSNVGIVEVPHLAAPVSARDFAEHLSRWDLDEICPVPIYFIRGVKNQTGENQDLEDMDIMRGEETETLALLEEYPIHQPYVFILPGSHSKFVFVNEQRQITGCLTSLTGELLENITLHTILADSVERRFASKESYQRDAALAGYRAAGEHGTGRALFSARILKMFGSEEQRNGDWTANYLLGVVLENDVRAIQGTRLLENADKAVGIVAGKEPFLSGLTDILREEGLFREVIKREAEDTVPISARGAFLVAKRWMKEREQEQ
jgi:2-dehydro-3-deoxygalactonokinase